jgi:formylmethanofuran dehydrogenase subunit A
MKIVLNNSYILHPQQKIDKDKTDILLIDGIISKIGNLTNSDLKEARESD